MNLAGIGKLFGIVMAVVAVNIVVWSPGLLGFRLNSSNAFVTALGVTILAVSAVSIVYGSYAILFRRTPVLPMKEIKTETDYKAVLQHYSQVGVLRNDMVLALEQLERVARRKQALLDVLGQQFEETELSYRKFYTVIVEVEKLFYMNLRGMLNKLSVFDASELAQLGKGQRSAAISNKLLQAKMALYQEYMSSVSGYLGANEEILLSYDKLLLEISQLGHAHYDDVEQMPCMKEMDALIKQTKYYN